jgi:hypothetical protein
MPERPAAYDDQWAQPEPGDWRPAGERRRSAEPRRDPKARSDQKAPSDRGSRRDHKPRRRRSVLFPVITVASVAVVAAAGFTAYRLGPGKPHAYSASATFEVIGNSKAIALLEAERQQIVDMNAATHVMNKSAKPLTVSVSQATSNNSSSTTSSAPVWTTPDPAGAQLIAKELMPSYGFSVSGQFSCLFDIWNRESGWVYDAQNTASGAYGIPQSLPASKMAMFGSDYLTNPTTQMKWGLWYIQQRYGTPCAAWNFELANGFY